MIFCRFLQFFCFLHKFHENLKMFLRNCDIVKLGAMAAFEASKKMYETSKIFFGLPALVWGSVAAGCRLFDCPSL